MLEITTLKLTGDFSLSFTSFSTEEECVFGIVGQPVSLPCLYPKLLTFVNFSIEWRRDDEVVLRSVWKNNSNVEELSVNSATISTHRKYSEEYVKELTLVLEEAAQGEETVFLCHSSGGFPEPAVHWRINHTNEPPEGSVRTLALSLPDSHLYNITSHLKVNIPKESMVSCTIENLSMNETLTSTSCE
uniref:Ig-like domain-containing protein n=1 Tax=Dicentrarchus labrax TaxID=13489 RepID=A0A8C4GRL7_DICLA